MKHFEAMHDRTHHISASAEEAAFAGYDRERCVWVLIEFPQRRDRVCD